MQFALLLFPITLLGGGTLDISMLLISRNRALLSADAASVAAAQVAEQYLAANGSNSTQIATAKTLATTAATNMFQANFQNAFGIANATLTVAITVNSNVVTAVVTPSYNLTPLFLGIANINSIPVSVASTATADLPPYYQIIFVVDVSGSMSIGGTATDVASLQTNPYIQCAFACHDPNDYNGVTITSYCNTNRNNASCQSTGGQYCPSRTTCTNVTSPYADKRVVASNAGIKLKIDYVVSAIGDFVTLLTPLINANPNYYSVGIDTIGTNFYKSLTPTTILSQIQSATSGVDVDIVAPVSANYGYTYLKTGLQSALSSLTNVGDGSAPNSRKTYLIFLSDGVEDVPGVSPWNRVTDINYGSQCTAIKNAGVNIISVLAPYPAVVDDQYTTLVTPMIGLVSPTMLGCASSGPDFFVATDGPAIQAAVSGAFGNIFGNSPRISQ